jgi:hypothetical protein
MRDIPAAALTKAADGDLLRFQSTVRDIARMIVLITLLVFQISIL